MIYYYLNVQFQGQSVNSAVQNTYRDLTWRWEQQIGLWFSILLFLFTNLLCIVSRSSKQFIWNIIMGKLRGDRCKGLFIYFKHDSMIMLVQESENFVFRNWLGRRGRLLLKCDGTRAETKFRLSAKRTIPFR